MRSKCPYCGRTARLDLPPDDTQFLAICGISYRDTLVEGCGAIVAIDNTGIHRINPAELPREILDILVPLQKRVHATIWG